MDTAYRKRTVVGEIRAICCSAVGRHSPSARRPTSAEQRFERHLEVRRCRSQLGAAFLQRALVCEVRAVAHVRARRCDLADWRRLGCGAIQRFVAIWSGRKPVVADNLRFWLFRRDFVLILPGRIVLCCWSDAASWLPSGLFLCCGSIVAHSLPGGYLVCAAKRRFPSRLQRLPHRLVLSTGLLRTNPMPCWVFLSFQLEHPCHLPAFKLLSRRGLSSSKMPVRHVHSFDGRTFGGRLRRLPSGLSLQGCVP